jgi:hypothetical protein
MKKIVVCIFLTAILQQSAFSQMKIGAATSPNINSVLELESTTQGFVLPRVTLIAINNTSPLSNTLLEGTMVYNIAPLVGKGLGVYYWENNQWNFLTNSSTAIVSADNALNISSLNNVELGGALITPTTISGDNVNNLTFTSTGTTSNPLSIAANTLTGASALQITANGLTTGSGLNITSNSISGSVNNSSNLISLIRTGANTNASHTAIGITSSVTNTGTTSTNIAGYFTASGASNNAAINVPSGGGQVIINQVAAASSSLTMVTAGSTYSDNQVSTITMWTASATWNLSTSGTANFTDLSGTDAVIEPGNYRSDGNIDVKLVVYYTNGSTTTRFNLNAYQTSSAGTVLVSAQPIKYTPTTSWTFYPVNTSGSLYSATSSWVNWNAGTNGWEIILNASNSAGTDNIRNVYLLVRPHNN